MYLKTDVYRQGNAHCDFLLHSQESTMHTHASNEGAKLANLQFHTAAVESL